MSMDGRWRALDNIFVERLWRVSEVRGSLPEGLSEWSGSEPVPWTVPGLLQYRDAAPGAELPDPGGGSLRSIGAGSLSSWGCGQCRVCRRLWTTCGRPQSRSTTGSPQPPWTTPKQVAHSRLDKSFRRQAPPRLIHTDQEHRLLRASIC